MPLGAVWQLHYRPAIGTGAARHWQQSERTDKTEVSIGGLAPGTAYQLKARGGYTVAAAVANSATEWFSFSAEAQAKTTGAPPPRARPPPKAPAKAAPPPAPAKRADSPPRVDEEDSGDDSDGTHASVPAYEDTDDSDSEPPPLVEPESARPAPAAAPAAVGGGGPPRRAAAPAPAPRARPAPEFESHSESDSDEDAPHEPPVRRCLVVVAAWHSDCPCWMHTRTSATLIVLSCSGKGNGGSVCRRSLSGNNTYRVDHPWPRSNRRLKPPQHLRTPTAPQRTRRAGRARKGSPGRRSSGGAKRRKWPRRAQQRRPGVPLIMSSVHCSELPSSAARSRMQELVQASFVRIT